MWFVLFWNRKVLFWLVLVLMVIVVFWSDFVIYFVLLFWDIVLIGLFNCNRYYYDGGIEVYFGWWVF